MNAGTSVSPQGKQTRRKPGHLVDLLKDRIRSGEYQVGDQLPTEQELARNTEFSRHAILQGLSILAAEGWIKRHQGRGTFVTKRVAEPYAGRGVIALICSDPGDAVMGGVIRGVNRALGAAGRGGVLLLDSAHDAKREAELIENLDADGVDGALLWSIDPIGNRESIAQLVKRKFPLVLIDRGLDDLEVPAVSVDHEHGAYEVTQHLVECGHTRIAHVTCGSSSGGPSGVFRAREAGYRRALQEAGLPIAEELIQYADPALMRLSHEPAARDLLAYEPVHRLMVQANRPTAIFMLNDIFAPSAFRALANQSLRVPDDVALAGFNNDPMGWDLPVPLTSYGQPAEEIGFTSAELLQKLVSGESVAADSRRLAGSLIIRASTRNARQKDI